MYFMGIYEMYIFKLCVKEGLFIYGVFIGVL